MDEIVRPPVGDTAFLERGSEMARRIRRQDWSGTPLGPMEQWPLPLRTLLSVMLGSNQPMFLAWGPERTLIYNDPYVEVLAGKHPAALGRPFLDVWEEIQDDLLPIVERAYGGEPIQMDDITLFMKRRGFPEETHFAFSYTPVRDETGAVAGFFCACQEITGQVLSERRLSQSEARLRSVLDCMGEAFGILDREFRILTFNEAALRLETRPLEDILGRTHWEVYPGSEHSEIGRLYKRALAEGKPVYLEHRYTWEDGTARWLETRAFPVPEGLAVFWRDISQRKEAEAALRESEARLRFMSGLDDALRTARDASGAMSGATEIVARHLGASRCAYADVDADDDRFVIRSDHSAPGLKSSVGTYSLGLFGSRAAADMRGGRTLVIRDVGTELAPGDGREMFLSIGVSAIVCCPLVKDGRLVAMMAVHQNNPCDWREDEIALVEAVVERCWAHVERVGAEARLRESEARYRTLFESIESGFCVVEVDLSAAEGRGDYRVIEANPAFYRQTGFHEGILGRWLRTAAPALEEHWYEVYGRVVRTGRPERFEQGSEHLGRWFDVYAFGVGEPEQGRVAVLFNDISAQRLAQLRLRELNESLEAQVAERTAERDRMWETSPDLMLVLDFEGVFRLVNPAWTTILGYEPEELVGHHVTEFVIPDDHEETVTAYELAAHGGQPRIVNRYRHKDGGLRWISWTAAPAGDLTYATGRDITAARERQAELEATQEQLRQSQKMEAMGQLTGGVAHDFNNLLTPIIGSLDGLVTRGVGSERERRLMAGALESAERAKVLVQRLLAFARRQPLQPGPVDVARLVGGMAELVASTSGPLVDVHVELPDDLPPARADANQLEMALLNLAVNARDAMPEGGVLTISAARVSVRPGHSAKLRPGHYVRLSVRDTGTGMDQATLARAVEPFFSTKGVGRGTGLGLSMVHGLASQLGGGLTIASSPGQGTTVELWLPISAVAADDADQAPGAVAVPHMLGTALLVDDEVLVRMSTADMLTALGYEVVEAGSAEEALRLMDEGLIPDLVVTDHLMPGLSGVDLARDLRSRQPDLPVLIVSGYAEMDGIAPGFPRLTKPFRAAELAGSLAALRPAGAA